ncbi:MAG: Hpt domain-containing protein [Oscillospiraceae bacterium]|nr:Hpt domain-containing protein [Oscillospiraceae bacterium]
MTVQELYAAVDGNYEAALKVLRMDAMVKRFILKLPNDKALENMLQGWAAKDEKAVFEGAHAVKGVCANLGLLSLSEKAGELAEEFRPGNARKLTDEQVSEKLDVLAEQYNRTTEAIRSFEMQ